MADLLLLGLFDNVETTADVIDEARALGVQDEQMTVMSHVPYPAKFFARKPVRLWFLPFVLGGAALGALVAFFLTYVTPHIYPIEVGGQGLRPVPPTAIIYFEMIALFSMLGAFASFLLQNRFPVLTRRMYDERITDGYIGLEVRAPLALAEQVAKVFEAHHARVIKREDAAAFKPQGIRHLLFWGAVGTGGLVALLIPLLLSYDIVQIPWINKMDDTVVIGAQQGPRLAAPAESVPVQGPVFIAGEPATAPLAATGVSLQRGQALYGTNCAMCHGMRGDKVGAEVGKYFLEIPQSLAARAEMLTDQDLFRVIRLGRNRMPGLAENLTPAETWDVVNYVRSLSD
jgi:mono/diheme cytochrome c family protein